MTLFTCVATIIVNLSGQPWTKLDDKNKKRAEYTCIKTYKDCLKKFIKKEQRHYVAICGGKKSE